MQLPRLAMRRLHLTSFLGEEVGSSIGRKMPSKHLHVYILLEGLRSVHTGNVYKLEVVVFLAEVVKNMAEVVINMAAAMYLTTSARKTTTFSL